MRGAGFHSRAVSGCGTGQHPPGGGGHPQASSCPMFCDRKVPMVL